MSVEKGSRRRVAAATTATAMVLSVGTAVPNSAVQPEFRMSTMGPVFQPDLYMTTSGAVRPVTSATDIGVIRFRGVKPVAPYDLRTAAATTLPSLNQPWFKQLPAGSALIVAEVSTDGSIVVTKMDDRLSEADKRGFVTGLASAQLQDAVRLHRTPKISLEKTPDHDPDENGGYTPGTNEIELWRGVTGEQLYFTALSYDLVLMHEARHAINEIWYGKATTGDKQPSRELQQRVSRLMDSCVDITDQQLLGYVHSNRRELSELFADMADELEAQHRENKAKGLPTDYLDLSAKYFRKAGMGLTKNDEVLRAIVAETGCNLPSFKHVVQLFSGTNDGGQGSPLWYARKQYPNLYRPVDEAYDKFDAAMRKPFDCFVDQTAINHLPGRPATANSGHPEDNPTEMASSDATARVVAPYALGKCAPGTMRVVIEYDNELRAVEFAATPSLKTAEAKDTRRYQEAFGL